MHLVFTVVLCSYSTHIADNEHIVFTVALHFCVQYHIADYIYCCLYIGNYLINTYLESLSPHLAAGAVGKEN